MENLDSTFNTPNPKNVKYSHLAMRTALILTGISIALNLVFYIAGLSEEMMKNPTLKWGNMLFSFALTFYFVFTALKNHQKNDLGGFMSIGRGIGFGSLTGLIAGLLTAVWTLIFMTWIAPETSDQIMEITMQDMAKQGLSEEQIEQQMPYVKPFLTPTAMGIMLTIFSVFFGFLCGWISGAILKKER